MNYREDINDLPVTAVDRERRDAAAGIQTTGRFARFSQRNDMFNRAFWDDEVRRPETNIMPTNVAEDTRMHRAKGAASANPAFSLWDQTLNASVSL